jgi:hypothetical protein
MWIYATIQTEYTPTQPEFVRKDLGSVNDVLKFNMVETT